MKLLRRLVPLVAVLAAAGPLHGGVTGSETPKRSSSPYPYPAGDPVLGLPEPERQPPPLDVVLRGRGAPGAPWALAADDGRLLATGTLPASGVVTLAVQLPPDAAPLAAGLHLVVLD